MAYKVFLQETIWATSHSLVFGYEVNIPADVLADPTPESFTVDVKVKLDKAFEAARQHANGEK